MVLALLTRQIHAETILPQHEKVRSLVCIQIDHPDGPRQAADRQIVDLFRRGKFAVLLLAHHGQTVDIPMEDQIPAPVAIDVPDGQGTDPTGHRQSLQDKALGTRQIIDVLIVGAALPFGLSRSMPKNADLGLVVVGKKNLVDAIPIQIPQHQISQAMTHLDEIRLAETQAPLRAAHGHLHVLHTRVRVVLVVRKRLNVIQELFYVVRRNGEAQAVKNDGPTADHAQDFSPKVKQRPPRIARRDGGGGLDEQPATDVTGHLADDALGSRTLKPQGIADGKNLVPDLDLLAIAQHQLGHVDVQLLFNFQQGQIHLRVQRHDAHLPEDLAPEGLTLLREHGYPNRAFAGHHVVVGDHVASGMAKPARPQTGRRLDEHDGRTDFVHQALHVPKRQPGGGVKSMLLQFGPTRALGLALDSLNTPRGQTDDLTPNRQPNLAIGPSQHLSLNLVAVAHVHHDPLTGRKSRSPQEKRRKQTHDSPQSNLPEHETSQSESVAEQRRRNHGFSHQGNTQRPWHVMI